MCTHRSGDKNKRGAYREQGMLRTRRKLFIKWTTEGIVKGSRAVQVFYDARQALIVGSMLVLL